MRVVSLVPSWTETLLQAGVNVVGRSRFCIHPSKLCGQIPAVGGTKDWDFDQVRVLQPDLIVLDQEENPKFMSEQNEIPVFATHVTGTAAVPGALALMGKRIQSPQLAEIAARWSAIDEWQGLNQWQPGETFPGLIEWGRQPGALVRNAIYVIWRNPWMSVSKDTFIGSMLGKCGIGAYLPDFDEKYPKFDLSAFPTTETLLLFSSEPYPFLRKKAVLNSVLNPYAFVNGECFSWFGVRSLEFLENLKTSAEKRR